MKIAVYAISKNEESFVERFCESARDADVVLIADTGSTDRTKELAEQCGAKVVDICISPWRFDKARDAALALLPSDVDVCVSLDLDEVLTEGWREEIEAVWKKDTTRLRYKYDWGQGVEYFYEKIHHRHGYHWHHPCHEYPRPDGRIQEVYAHTNKLLVVHKPDPVKSRGQYLPLLKLSVEEDPNCPRNAFYYARELTFYRQWEEAVVQLKRFLDLPSATWPHEICYAMRLLGGAYKNLKQYEEALFWYKNACKAASNTREPWFDLAEFCYETTDWEQCYQALSNLFVVERKEDVYTMNPDVWGYKPHDYMALAAFYTGKYEEAVAHGQKACEMNPDDSRLSANMSFYQQKVA